MSFFARPDYIYLNTKKGCEPSEVFSILNGGDPTGQCDSDGIPFSSGSELINDPEFISSQDQTQLFFDDLAWDNTVTTDQFEAFQRITFDPETGLVGGKTTDIIAVFGVPKGFEGKRFAIIAQAIQDEQEEIAFKRKFAEKITNEPQHELFGAEDFSGVRVVKATRAGGKSETGLVLVGNRVLDFSNLSPITGKNEKLFTDIQINEFIKASANRQLGEPFSIPSIGWNESQSRSFLDSIPGARGPSIQNPEPEPVDPIPVLPLPVLPPPDDDPIGPCVHNPPTRKCSPGEEPEFIGGCPSTETCFKEGDDQLPRVIQPILDPSPKPSTKTKAQQKRLDKVKQRTAERRGRVIAAKDGFEGFVNEPTLFLAGEAGREHVKITPLKKQAGAFDFNPKLGLDFGMFGGSQKKNRRKRSEIDMFGGLGKVKKGSSMNVFGGNMFGSGKRSKRSKNNGGLF